MLLPLLELHRCTVSRDSKATAFPNFVPRSSPYTLPISSRVHTRVRHIKCDSKKISSEWGVWGQWLTRLQRRMLPWQAVVQQSLRVHAALLTLPAGCFLLRMTISMDESVIYIITAKLMLVASSVKCVWSYRGSPVIFTHYSVRIYIATRL